MTPLSLTFQRRATQDIGRIHAYVLDESREPAVADRYIARLRRSIERIPEAPLGYPARPEAGPDIRMSVFERRIVILFRVRGDTVQILRVLGAGRDWSKR